MPSSQNNCFLKKTYLFIQKYGYITLFILWFLMELILNTSTIGRIIPDNSIFSTTQRILKYSLLVYIVFFQTYSKKELFIIIPITVLIYYSARLSHFHELFYTWLFIIGAKHTSFDRLVPISAIILSICIPVFGILCKAGFLPDAGIYRGEDFRTALGFVHPNSFGVRVFILVSCWCFIRQASLSAVDYILMLTISLFVWIIPNSRTCSLCIILLAMILFLYSIPGFKSSRFRNFTDCILIFIAAGINVISVLLSLLYNDGNAFMRFADKILSGRLSIANQLYHEFGITLFGQQIYVNMSERIYAGLGTTAIHFDNSYMRILLHWGIIVYFVVSVLVIWGLVYEKRRKNPTLFLIFFMVLIYSFSEKILYQGTYCVFILVLSDLLYNKLSKEKTIQHAPAL